MAKWGEGDPRWIVEERPDATNVNNWHWTEKNATPWSKQRLRALLEGLEVSAGSADRLLNARITKLSKLDGEATANNRKAKLIFLYEWDLKAEWEGTDGEAQEVKGELTIPNLSDENTPDEVDVEVTTTSGPDDAAYKLKQLMHKQGSAEIRKRVATYIRELKEEFAAGLVLPTANGTAGPNKTKLSVDAVAAAKAKQTIITGVSDVNLGDGCKINTRSLALKDTFKCPPSELYAAFTKPEMMSAFSGGRAEVTAEKGGRFSLYGGMVQGSFESLQADSQLVMLWRLKSYPSGHHARITLDFEKGQDSTTLKLTADSVPESEAEKTEDGWRRHYFENIKRTFGFASTLF